MVRGHSLTHPTVLPRRLSWDVGTSRRGREGIPRAVVLPDGATECCLFISQAALNSPPPHTTLGKVGDRLAAARRACVFLVRPAPPTPPAYRRRMAYLFPALLADAALYSWDYAPQVLRDHRRRGGRWSHVGGLQRSAHPHDQHAHHRSGDPGTQVGYKESCLGCWCVPGFVCVESNPAWLFFLFWVVPPTKPRSGCGQTQVITHRSREKRTNIVDPYLV